MTLGHVHKTSNPKDHALGDGARAQRPVQAPGRKGEDEDQTWAVKAKTSKEGRGPKGKDISEGAEVRTVLRSPGGVFRWAGTIWEAVAGRHVGLAKF